MPEDSRSDEVEKFLTEQKSMEGRKQALIDDLLKQREAALKAFDEKLAKLGYEDNSGRPTRSHHKTRIAPAAGANAAAKPKTKA
jgi:hypothetical protein